MSYNLAVRIPEERAKVNVDLAASVKPVAIQWRFIFNPKSNRPFGRFDL